MIDYSKLKVLVLGARERHALCIVRSLGAMGCQVFTADCFHFVTASLSKYSKGFFLYANPESNPERFLLDLELILRENKFDFVFAVSDLLPILLSKEMERFRGLAHFALTPKDIFDLANSKNKCFEIAEKISLPAPKTAIVESMESVQSAADLLQFPLVLKPVSKTHLNNEKKSTSLKVHYVHSKPELLNEFKQFVGSGRKFLLQEYVPGNGGEGVGALCEKGEAKVLFSYKRLHEFPLTGGASTLRISTNDLDLKEKAAKLLKAMNWDGVAMVEFKRDIRNSEAKLIEVNGRYWGSLALAFESGVDFPRYHLQSLLGEQIDYSGTYQPNVKLRWFLPGDLMYWFQRILKDGKTAVLEFLKEPFVKDDVWSWSDPLPILGELRSSLFYLVQVLKKQRSLTGEFKG